MNGWNHGFKENQRKGTGMKRASISLLALIWLCGVGAVSARVLEVVPSVSADGVRVLLREIVRGGGALPDGWGDREIVEAPLPGKDLTLSLSDIATALSAYEDMRNVVLRGRSHVRISSPSQALEADLVDKALEAYGARHEKWSGRRLRVCRDRPLLSAVPAGEVRIEVQDLREDLSSGKLFAELNVHGDGGQSTSGKSITVPVVEMRPYWAAARPLLRGAILTEKDVVEHWAESGGAARHYPVTQPVAGMEVRRGIPAERVLTADMLAPPVYAKRGEIVRIITQKGPLTVTLRARALSDGRRDEQIGCVNERSGRRMYVRLVRPREGILDSTEGQSL